MKQLIIITSIIFIGPATNAQQAQPFIANNPFPKTITVNGSAEMEIIPDEIYVNIELKEYQKRGEAKKDIEAIKSAFLGSCKLVGIPDSAVSIASYTGDNPFYWKKRKKDPNLFTGIAYQIKFKSGELMDKLIEKLDDDATQNFQIVSVNHSQIKEFRKLLKIQAVKAAKDKGNYLAEAIGEKLGETVTIYEPRENNPIQPRYLSPSNQNLSLDYYRSDSIMVPAPQQVDFKKMKLRFEVEVIFALK